MCSAVLLGHNATTVFRHLLAATVAVALPPTVAAVVPLCLALIVQVVPAELIVAAAAVHADQRLPIVANPDLQLVPAQTLLRPTAVLRRRHQGQLPRSLVLLVDLRLLNRLLLSVHFPPLWLLPLLLRSCRRSP